MSVSDIQSLYKDEGDYLVIHTPVLFGYLYHLDQKLQYLILFLVVSILPVILLEDNYVGGPGIVPKTTSDLAKRSTKVIIVITLLHMIIWIYGIFQISPYVNGTNLLASILFFSGIFIIMSIFAIIVIGNITRNTDSE